MILFHLKGNVDSEDKQLSIYCPSSLNSRSPNLISFPGMSEKVASQDTFVREASSCHILSLPPEMIKLILQHFTPFELLDISKVCKQFRQVALKPSDQWQCFIVNSFRCYYAVDSYLLFLERLKQNGADWIELDRSKKTPKSLSPLNRTCQCRRVKQVDKEKKYALLFNTY